MTTTSLIQIEGMKLGAALNARVHWTKRAARAKKERDAIWWALCSQKEFVFQPWRRPYLCTLIRIAPRMLDDDNLVGAFKSIRDEVAACFGVDDGPKGPISWRYEQRKGEPKQYAVHIALTWGDSK